MKWIGIMIVLLVIVTPLVCALDIPAPTEDEKTQFKELLEPVFRVYNLIKYVASVIAMVALLIAGITYMTSGADPKKRDQAKQMATYVVIGLFVIWAAPLLVNFIVG